MISFRSNERDKERWQILKDGEVWREVHRSIFGRKPVFPSLSVDRDCGLVFDHYEYQKVKAYIFRRLTKQSYHSEQLAKLLRERLVQDKTIDRVICEFKLLHILDDEAWLQNFMSSQQKRYSLRAMLLKLKSKGLSSNTLKQLAIEWNRPEKELEAIQRLLQTRYRSKDLSQYHIKQKVIAALLRKGYAFDQVKAALAHQEITGQTLSQLQ